MVEFGCINVLMYQLWCYCVIVAFLQGVQADVIQYVPLQEFGSWSGDLIRLDQHLDHSPVLHRVHRDVPPSVTAAETVTTTSISDVSTIVSASSTEYFNQSDDVLPAFTADTEDSTINADLPLPGNPQFPSFNPYDNVTVVEDEDHRYYKSRVVTATSADDSLYYWVSEQMMYKAETHVTLSESYRSAVTVPLSFTFIFYGHEVKQITIATGGFLYMSDFLHQWLTATQYVAPLMANFDTQLGNNSYIRYMDNGTVFVVWWEDAFLQDFHEVGPFSFQAMLHKDGRIIFSYKQVPPVTVLKIPTARHPVKVGLSDAYYMDKPANSEMRQRTIYEYHRVEINMTQISSNATVVMTPVPTCIMKKTCIECIEASGAIPFTCQWCPTVGRCSDGLDRKRQEWQEKSCDKVFITAVDQCQYASAIQSRVARIMKSSSAVTDASIVGVVLLTFIIVLVFVVAAWLIYAYRNPNSQSGIWLIQHRPANIIERVHQIFYRRSSHGANKYEVAMHPEAESLA